MIDTLPEFFCSPLLGLMHSNAHVVGPSAPSRIAPALQLEAEIAALESQLTANHQTFL